MSAAEAALRGEIREFLADARSRGAFVPRVDSWILGHSPEFSRELGRRGWIGVTWPARYGGRARPEAERYAIGEEMLAAGAPVAAHWVAERQCAPHILRLGSEDQRQRFLPAIAKGECFFTVAMSEPRAGSDLASARTTAEQRPGGWSLNGRKIWTSHAHESHFAVVLCRTSDETDRHEGFSQLIVDLASPGISIQPIRLFDAESHFCEVLFEDVFVPDAMVLGVVGRGWSQLMSELSLERSGPERLHSTAPLLLAVLDRASTDRDAIVLGRVVARHWGLRSLASSVIAALQRGQRPVVEAALVKELGTRYEQDLIDRLRELLPPEPDPESPDLRERYLAQAIAAGPSFTIRGGTNEILRGIIAKTLDA